MNVPGLPPSSTSVMVSISPVVPFVTDTTIVPSPAKSASTTLSARSSPTEPATIDTTPSDPPEIGSVSETVGGLPPGLATSK